MTIWILAVLLLASTAGLGLRQGVVRVAFSLAGIVIGALLALPLAHVTGRGLAAMGVKNPVLLWLIPPAIVFAVILAIFKFAGLAVHKKVEVYFKYKAGDLRLALWERLTQRLGLCLGLLNGAAYLLLLSFVIYTFSYWTVQLADSSNDPKWVRVLNQLGRDLQSTGMSKAALAISRMPVSYYQAADLAGVIYHTPLLEARLDDYPGFLSLAEQPSLQALLNDKGFTEMWQEQKPVSDLLKQPQLSAIVHDPALLNSIWAVVKPNLGDLPGYLATGRSANYTDPILGRWDFDVNGALSYIRRTNPKISFIEMKQTKQFLATYFPKTRLVAAPDQRVYMKNLPEVQTSAGGVQITTQDIQGQWTKSGDDYLVQLTFNGKPEKLEAKVQGDRMVVTGRNPPMAFTLED